MGACISDLMRCSPYEYLFGGSRRLQDEELDAAEEVLEQQVKLEMGMQKLSAQIDVANASYYRTLDALQTQGRALYRKHGRQAAALHIRQMSQRLGALVRNLAHMQGSLQAMEAMHQKLLRSEDILKLGDTLQASTVVDAHVQNSQLFQNPQLLITHQRAASRQQDVLGMANESLSDTAGGGDEVAGELVADMLGGGGGGGGRPDYERLPGTSEFERHIIAQIEHEAMLENLSGVDMPHSTEQKRAHDTVQELVSPASAAVKDKPVPRLETVAAGTGTTDDCQQGPG